MRNSCVIVGIQDHNFVFNFELNENYHIEDNNFFISSKDKEEISFTSDNSTTNSENDL